MRSARVRDRHLKEAAFAVVFDFILFALALLLSYFGFVKYLAKIYSQVAELSMPFSKKKIFGQII